MDDRMDIRPGSRLTLRLDAAGLRVEAGADRRLEVRLADMTRNETGEVFTFGFPGGEIEVRQRQSAEHAFRIEAVVRARVKLSRVGLRFRYLPAEAAAWPGCRKSFHWLPNIKRRENQFTGDHNFRSPAAIYRLGKGRMILNALRIRQELGRDPVAERLLTNMINYAEEIT